MLRFTLSLAFCLVAIIASAQVKLKGRVLENGTRIGLAGIRVDNITTKQTTLTDSKGNFTVPAKLNDVLSFTGFAYATDSVLVTDLFEKEYFINIQTNQLKQVDVVNAALKNNNTYYDPEFHGQTIVKHRDRLGNVDGGITIRMKYWKKDERKRAKLEKMEQRFAVMDRIREVFIPQIVGKYVPLKDVELDNFIALYTPNTDVFSSKKFNLIDYLNDSYKKYQALPPEQRIPPALIN